MTVLGTEGRRFESCLPDHFSKTYEAPHREQTGNERKLDSDSGAACHGIITDKRLRALLDAQEFSGEDDWLAPPRSGYGFMAYCPIRFLAYLERFGAGPGIDPKLIPTPPNPKVFARLRSKGFADYTYFAKGSVTGRIKIGRSVQPRYRIKQLQYSGNGEPAERLVIIPGGSCERGYHRLFAKWLHGNEWFAPHPDILAEIARLSAIHKDK